MQDPVYIGLAVTSHNSGIYTSADFSHISITGNVTTTGSELGEWDQEAMGVEQRWNDPDRFYAKVNGSIVVHADPNTLISNEGWSEWEIPFSAFGGNMAAVTSVGFGVGNPFEPKGGAVGMILLDDLKVGKAPQVWDAALQWSLTENPNGLWSYCNGDISSTDFATLCLFDPTIICESTAWVSPVGGPEAAWPGRYFECDDLDPDEIEAHGPFLVRWTSRIDGTVKVNGTLWQFDYEPARRMRYLLRHNGVKVNEVAVTALGKANKVVLLTREGNPDIEISVRPGDILDCIIDGAGPGGNGINTFAAFRFKITEL